MPVGTSILELITPEEASLILEGKKSFDPKRRVSPPKKAEPPVAPARNISPAGADRQEPLSILHTLMKPFNAASSGANSAITSLMDKPGDTKSMLQAAGKGASESWNDIEDRSSMSEQMAKRGIDIPMGAGLLSDILIDPTNLIPGAAMALPFRAGSKLAEVVKATKAAEEIGKHIPDAASIMAKRLPRDVSDVRMSELLAKLGGKSEKGFAATDLMLPATTTVAGAATGAAADKENRLRGALVGATAGAGAGFGAARLAKGFIPTAAQAAEQILPETQKVAKTVPGLGDIQTSLVDGHWSPDPKLKTTTPNPTNAKLAADDEKLFPFLEKHTGLSPESKKDIKDIFFEGDNFWKERRMGMSWEQANQLADDVVIKIDDTGFKKGTILNQEHALALRSSAMGLMDQATGVMKDLEAFEKAADPNILAKYGAKGSLEMKAIAEEARLKATAALQSMAGVRSETGRALNSYKQLRRAREMGDMDFLTKALEKGAPAEEAWKVISTFGDDKVRQYRYIRDLSKPGAQEYWKWFYKSNLLSGPLTHVRNFVGNTSNLLLNATATAARSPKEFAASAPGYWAGMSQGLEKASFMFKNGFSLEHADQLADRAPEVFGGKMLPNMVGRSLEAADEFFRTIGFSTELYGQAYQQATKKGLQGAALADEVARIVADPSVELIKAAKDKGANLVFRQKPGKLQGGFKAAREGLNSVGTTVADTLVNKAKHPLAHGLANMPYGDFIMPFIETPANIMKAGIEMTPVGAVKGAMTGGREGTQMVYKSAVGTAMLAYAAKLAVEGRLTGAAPSDPAQRDQFWAERIPNAVKIGDKWVSYQQFAPIAMPLSLIANAFETYKQGGDVGIGDIIAKTANSTLNQSYLEGMFSLVEAINNSDQAGGRWAGRMMTGFIPGAGLLRNTRNAIDPTIRNPKGAVETVKAALPGLSKTVSPRVDYAGDEAKLRGNTVSRFINPVDHKTAVEDKTRRALVESDSYYSKPPVSLKGEKLSPEQSVRLQKLYGRAMKQALSQLTQNEQFKALPLERRRARIATIKRDVSQAVREQIRKEVQ